MCQRAKKSLCKEHTEAWSRDGKTPRELFDVAASYINEENPDALFVTGDCVDYVGENNANYLKEQFAKINTDVLYVLGNHESVNYREKVENPKIYYPLYECITDGNPSFWVKDYGDLLIVGIDNSDKKITKEQIAMLKEEIKRNIPIILLMHIPVSTATIKEPIENKWGEGAMSYFALDGDNPIDTTVEFCELLKEKDNNIAAIFTGHIHTPYKGEFANGKMLYAAGTVFDGYVRKIEVLPEL